MSTRSTMEGTFMDNVMWPQKLNGRDTVGMRVVEMEQYSKNTSHQKLMQSCEILSSNHLFFTTCPFPLCQS